MRQVGIKVCDIPIYEGLTNLVSFLIEFEEKVSEPRRLLDLSFALKVTPARWWVVYKQSISEWPQFQRLMEVLFG